jgi:hypothetical protein
MFRRLAFAGIAAVLSFLAALPAEKTVYARAFQQSQMVAENIARRPITRQIAWREAPSGSEGSANFCSCVSFRFTLPGIAVSVASEWSWSGDLESVAISAWYHRQSGRFTVRLLIAGTRLFLEFPLRGSLRSSI